MSRKDRQLPNNYIKLLDSRQIDDRIASRVQSRLHVTDTLISRLGLEKELEGHSGCVNCLEWNETGRFARFFCNCKLTIIVILFSPFIAY